MKIPRQYERRARFLAALKDMPRFETWTTEDYSVPPQTVATNMYEAGLQAVTKAVEIEPPRIRHHARLIPRRVRRDMARKLSQRQYRVDHNLPEPR